MVPPPPGTLTHSGFSSVLSGTVTARARDCSSDSRPLGVLMVIVIPLFDANALSSHTQEPNGSG